MNLDDLYQEIILDHFKHPRNAGPLPDGAEFSEGENPNCGDLVRVTAELVDDLITAVRFHAKGCAISIASASIMSENLLQVSREEGQARIEAFEARIKEQSDRQYPDEDPMSALLTIRRFPMRLKCATLPWTAMREFLAR